MAGELFRGVGCCKSFLYGSVSMLLKDMENLAVVNSRLQHGQIACCCRRRAASTSVAAALDRSRHGVPSCPPAAIGLYASIESSCPSLISSTKPPKIKEIRLIHRYMRGHSPILLLVIIQIRTCISVLNRVLVADYRDTLALFLFPRHHRHRNCSPL